MANLSVSHLLGIKHLNQEDIEEFGFKKEDVSCFYGADSYSKWSKPKYAEWKILDYGENVERRHEIKFFHPDDSKGETWFYGNIKNRSELQVLLRQLNIPYKLC